MSTKGARRRDQVERQGYRIAQWCEAFQCSRATAYKMMHDGRLPFVVIGGRRFITNAAADELLTAGETGT